MVAEANVTFAVGTLNDKVVPVNATKWRNV